MTTTMDIVVAYDSSLLISMYKLRISDTVRSVTAHVPSLSQNDVRMCLAEFQSHINNFTTQIYPFTGSKEQFYDWIDAVPTESVTEKSCKSIANVLAECLTLDWRLSANKLVILFTDGPPCNLLNNDCCTNGLDLWKIADELKENGIVLAIVGLEPTMTIFEDFYCALARKTDGEYLPLINAGHALSLVVRDLIRTFHGLSRAFRNLDMYFDIECGSQYKYSYCKGRVSYMLKHCHTMDDIREELYTFTRETNEVINDQTFEIGSPEEYSYMNSYHEHTMMMTSTPIPINDDEGYRTRLPTTASMNSSIISIVNSAMSYEDTDSIILQWSD